MCNLTVRFLTNKEVLYLYSSLSFNIYDRLPFQISNDLTQPPSPLIKKEKGNVPHEHL